MKNMINTDQDKINAELFGNDQKTSNYEEVFSFPSIKSNKLEETARKYNVNATFLNKNISVPEPNTIEEAVNILGFWEEILKERKNTPKKIEFAYQERNQEIPLSYLKKMLRKTGFNIKPQEKEGEIKYESVSPKAILSVGNFLPDSESFVKMITDKREWERLNKISQGTDTFSAPYVWNLENLCYRVNVPLQCILKMELNE